jgi:hypothetical protein
LVWVVRNVDLVAINCATWKSHICSSLHAMTVQSLAFYSMPLIQYHPLVPGETYSWMSWP